jgi:uncharacterized Fe-S cluster protein YjdI
VGRRLQTYVTEAITVTYDPNRCVHAADCVRTLPLVFDTSRRRWIEPQHAPAAEVAAVVRRCPTGALQYTIPSGESEVGDEPCSMRVTRNGPLYVRGDVTVSTEDGTVVAAGTRLALCRCGASQRKPFCDGSHRASGFVAG